MATTRNETVTPAEQQNNRNNPYDPHRLIRLKEVLQLIPVKKSTWWQWCKIGKAPAPIHLGRCTCWRYAEVVAFTGKEVHA